METLSVTTAETPLASLAAMSPMSTWSTGSVSPFSGTPSPAPFFKWNTFPTWDINNFRVTPEPNTLPASLMCNNLIKAMEVPELHPFQASLLPPPGSPARYPAGSSRNPYGVVSPLSPQFPFATQANRPAAPLPTTKPAPVKRIGRPPGTFKRVIQVPKSFTKEEEDNEEVVCRWDHCNTVFTEKQAFYEHVRDHLLQCPHKDYKCKWEGCDRPAYTLLYQIFTHVRRHTKEKPHQCQYPDCTKSYSRAENLKTHVRSHTGEKPYFCKKEHCDRCFTNASDCSKHENRVHSDEKPYACLYPECTKRYTDPSSLRKHTLQNHPDYREKTAHLPKPVRPQRKRGPKAKVQNQQGKNNNQIATAVQPLQANAAPRPMFVLPQGNPTFLNAILGLMAMHNIRIPMQPGMAGAPAPLAQLTQCVAQIPVNLQ